MAFKTILLSFLLFSALGFSQETDLENPLYSFPVTHKDGIDVHGLLGETLEYEISWSFLTVGKAYIKIDRIVEVSTGVYAYHIVSGARSTRLIENFYPVKDLNEALLDIDISRSYGYYKKINEGKYKRSEWVLYDFRGKQFSGEILKKGQKFPLSGQLSSENVFDILSSLYVFRVRRIGGNKGYKLNVNTKKNWDLTVKDRGTEKIQTPLGKYKCRVLEPMVGEEGIFVPKKGKRLLVYISEKEKLPVMLKAEVFIGSVAAKLVRVKKSAVPPVH